VVVRRNDRIVKWIADDLRYNGSDISRPQVGYRVIGNNMERMKMIGQRELLKKIDGQIERGKFPRASILIGEKGSGRKTLAYHISEKFNLDMCVVNPTLDEMTEVYNDLHKEEPPSSIYVFDDGDFIPDEAMDILKSMIKDDIDATFIIICEILDNIPQEIKKNAVTYMMETYSYEDKCEYFRLNRIDNLTEDQEEFVLETATNIGEVKEMCYMDIDGLRQSVRDMLDTLKTDENVSKIAFREDDDRFPIHILWKAFIAVCGEQVEKKENSLIYCRLIAITGDYLQELSMTEDTRDLFNSWLLAIEDEWTDFFA
jgi:hypothetical protein